MLEQRKRRPAGAGRGGEVRPRPKSAAGALDRDAGAGRSAGLVAELTGTGLTRPRLLSSGLDQIYAGLGFCMTARQAVNPAWEYYEQDGFIICRPTLLFIHFFNILHI
jgi:hypothetical protein